MRKFENKEKEMHTVCEINENMDGNTNDVWGRVVLKMESIMKRYNILSNDKGQNSQRKNTSHKSVWTETLS